MTSATLPHAKNNNTTTSNKNNNDNNNKKKKNKSYSSASARMWCSVWQTSPLFLSHTFPTLPPWLASHG